MRTETKTCKFTYENCTNCNSCLRNKTEIRDQLSIMESMKKDLEKQEEESEGEICQGWEGYFLQEKIKVLKWVLGETVEEE